MDVICITCLGHGLPDGLLVEGYGSRLAGEVKLEDGDGVGDGLEPLPPHLGELQVVQRQGAGAGGGVGRGQEVTLGAQGDGLDPELRAG